MEKLDQKIGEKLRKIREERNMTMREVAEAIDINYSYVSRIENGKVPSLDKLKKLCDLYQVPVSSLFGEEIEVDNNLKSLGVEWISIEKDIKEHNISVDQVKKALEMLKILKEL